MLCRIEEIDLVNNLIIIHCRGIEAPIKLKFEEIINDSVMLANFSPKHASWIGYYFGKHYKKLINQKNLCSIPFDFTENSHDEKYSIIMVTRNGNLVYVDNTTSITYTKHPIGIMSTKDLITRFKPLQACYIGILSGVSEKVFNLKSSFISHTPQLKLVN